MTRVTVDKMVATVAARTLGLVSGRHVLAIQDTTMVRSAARGLDVALHPVIAVDAIDATLLGLVEACFMVRNSASGPDGTMSIWPTRRAGAGRGGTQR